MRDDIDLDALMSKLDAARQAAVVRIGAVQFYEQMRSRADDKEVAEMAQAVFAIVSAETNVVRGQVALCRVLSQALLLMDDTTRISICGGIAMMVNMMAKAAAIAQGGTTRQ